MRIVISSGHGAKISGAVGPSPWGLHEHTEAVRVVDATAVALRNLGVEVITYEDTISDDQQENLERIVDFHNSKTRDYDVSVHFNSTPGAKGTEVYYGSPRELAQTVCDEICIASGLVNRGAKDGSGLYFIAHTAKPAILIEVCFVDTKSDCDTYRQKFDAICVAIAEGISGKQTDRPERPPPEAIEPPPADGHPTIGQGDSGAAVEELQAKLGCLTVDGDFGPTTDTWVKAFQGACGLSKDGVVGPMTWEQVDDLRKRVEEGEPPLPPALARQIYTMAQTSEIADYSWRDRGVPPHGYIPGIALAFAYALRHPDSAVDEMCQGQGNPDVDALAYYEADFKKQGMSNRQHGWVTMRHLFVMLTGLGPRESSGRYCEGRDLSASNVESDTCEAGLFQTSWNIRSAHPSIPPMLPAFWENPNGFLDVFKDGISATKNNLDSYGSGDGIKYQFLSRYCPLFHIMVTGVGLRTRRAHWGPISRIPHEVEIKREADDLLKEIQDIALAEA